MPPTVFISYSHADEDWKDRLVIHLAVLEQEGRLKTWNDRNIVAGEDWFEAICEAMKAAKVALFLVSAASLKSEFILHEEIPRLLERREKEGMVFFPVVVKSCVWQELPWLKRFQARPVDGRPLARFQGDRRDAELAKIAKEILKIVRDGGQAPPKPAEPTPIVSEPTTVPTGITLPSLHQLPSPPADFTGREEDLSVLRSRLANGGSVAIFGLRGMGGIGKTALALKLAEELTPVYPDAQLYLDLKGVDPQPLTAAQAMAHVVRSFHPEARLPESEADLAGLYRSVLHGKRVLLLMDNTASKAQVEPLIPPAGSLLLVTSRFHFTLPGLFARDLDEMSAEDARVLLLTISPRVASDANAIARLCGYLPLALRLAGSTLAERPDLSPGEYARRFAEGKERLGPVDGSLSLSYELLSDDQRRLWRLLAVFPGTFDAPAAAAIWGKGTDSASKMLGDLFQNSLVEWEEKEGRYRLHDLARDFAERLLEETEREVAMRRHSEYYLHLLETADDLYLKGGESVGHALRLFDTEWDNIQVGFAWASGRSQDDEASMRICDDYPKLGIYCLALRQPPRERIRWIELALAAARQRRDRSHEGLHLNTLGAAYMELGELRRAIEFYEQRLAIARDIADRRGEGTTLNNLGVIYADLGETHRAIELYEQWLAIARDIGDRRGEGNALGGLGRAYADLGETRRAIEFYEQWLVSARDIGDRQGEGKALGNLGNAHADLGESHLAIKLYEQVLGLAREIGDRLGEANASWNLGLEIEKEGDLARAADLMQVLVTYLTELGHPDTEKTAAYVAALRARIAKKRP